MHNTLYTNHDFSTKSPRDWGEISGPHWMLKKNAYQAWSIAMRPAYLFDSWYSYIYVLSILKHDSWLSINSPAQQLCHSVILRIFEHGVPAFFGSTNCGGYLTDLKHASFHTEVPPWFGADSQTWVDKDHWKGQRWSLISEIDDWTQHDITSQMVTSHSCWFDGVPSSNFT